MVLPKFDLLFFLILLPNAILSYLTSASLRIMKYSGWVWGPHPVAQSGISCGFSSASSHVIQNSGCDYGVLMCFTSRPNRSAQEQFTQETGTGKKTWSPFFPYATLAIWIWQRVCGHCIKKVSDSSELQGSSLLLHCPVMRLNKVQQAVGEEIIWWAYEAALQHYLLYLDTSSSMVLSVMTGNNFQGWEGACPAPAASVLTVDARDWNLGRSAGHDAQALPSPNYLFSHIPPFFKGAYGTWLSCALFILSITLWVRLGREKWFSSYPVSFRWSGNMNQGLQSHSMILQLPWAGSLDRRYRNSLNSFHTMPAATDKAWLLLKSDLIIALCINDK